MIRFIQLAPIVLALGLVSGSAHAALQGRDLNGSVGSFEAIYDTDLDITWLADANYAKTSGYDADGGMNWTAANAWAAGLVYGGYDDWRLPTALNQDRTGPCADDNCTGSEMGHLFYSELGGTAGNSILNSGDPDLALFQNIQPFVYWSGTEYAPYPDNAWLFGTRHGYQYATYKDFELWTWAVRPGDVAAVPEAQTYALMLAGLGLIGWRARRRG